MRPRPLPARPHPAAARSHPSPHGRPRRPHAPPAGPGRSPELPGAPSSELRAPSPPPAGRARRPTPARPAATPTRPPLHRRLELVRRTSSAPRTLTRARLPRPQPATSLRPVARTRHDPLTTSNKKSHPTLLSNLARSGMGAEGGPSPSSTPFALSLHPNRTCPGQTSMLQSKGVSMQFLQPEFKLVLCILPGPLQCGCILILTFLREQFK